MAINISTDGHTYNNIRTITVGGKTLNLLEEGGGSAVGIFNEYNKIENIAPVNNALQFEHGLSEEPKLIIISINLDDISGLTGIMIGGLLYPQETHFDLSTGFTTNVSTGAASAVVYHKKDATTTQYATYSIVNGVVTFIKSANNQSFSNYLYTAECYA